MIQAILPFIAGVFSLLLGIVVLVSGTNSKNNKWPFILFATSIAVWSMCIGLFKATNSESFGEALVGIYYIAALLIAYAFLIFSISYAGRKMSRFTVVVALIPWLIASLWIATPGVFVSHVDASRSVVELVMPYYVMYCFIFICYVGIGLGYMTYRSYSNKTQARMRALVLSLFVCMVGGAYFNLILPLYNNYDMIAFGPLFVFLMVFAVFYAIARHGLFDIRLAVVRTVTYVLSLATLAAVYVVVAYIVFHQILGQTSTISQTIINVILTLILAFIFQPVKRFFDHLTNRLFYKDGYNADDFYETLSKILGSTSDLRTLLERTAQSIASTLKSEQVFFFVYTQHGFMSAGTEKHSRMPLVDADELRNAVDITSIESSSISQHLRRMLVSHKVNLVMPLRRDQTLIGYLYLGEHKTSTYSRRDRRVLQTVADEIVIAIQNALSVQEVKDLNANLEQRIESATKELRTSNAQLQKLDEAKDEFISMASHQLRTPLTSIKGYVSMLIDGDIGPVTAEQKHLLQEAFMSSERMVRLISDFLNVSRLQTGKFVVEKHPVDLGVLVQHEVDALEQNAASRGLSFAYKKPKNVPTLELDESKFQQVVMNFCDNAIYYSKEGSKIKVALEKVGDSIELTVKDTGIGVPLEEQEQLFNKFFRATNARKQRPDGTGVGLFLAKKVIDAHGGEIIFHSIPGKGSTFGFRLPLR